MDTEVIVPDTYFPSAPFRGIRAFRFIDRSIFSGREDKLVKLIDLTLLYRGNMVYGQSGIGKSSLIAAGLIPELIRENFQPEIIRVFPKADAVFTINRIVVSESPVTYLPSIFDKANNNKEKINLSYEEFENGLQKEKIKYADKKPEDEVVSIDMPTVGDREEYKIPVLIFDQFEELITYFEEAGQKGEDLAVVKERLALQMKIITLLQHLYYNQKLQIKLLFIFREDYLPKFSRLIDAIPDLRDHYIRIKPLKIDKIREIITYPFHLPFLKPFSDSLTDVLTQKIEEYFDKDDLVLTDVQIVCQELYKIDNEEERLKQLDGVEPVKTILERFYKGLLDEFSAEDKAIATDILSLLVLNERTRNVLPLLSLTDGLSEKYSVDSIRTVLDQLSSDSKRLTRKEIRKDGLYYEISTETLIPYINQQKIQKEKEEELIEINKEKEKDEKKRLKVIRDKWKVTIIALSCFLLLLIFFLVNNLYNAKKRNEEITNMAMFFRANQLFEAGDLREAFGIYKVLFDSIGSKSIRKQISKIQFDFSDIPGSAIYTLKNNYIFSEVNDSTSEVWRITSNTSFNLVTIYKHIELKVISPDGQYAALYDGNQIVFLNTETGKDTVLFTTKEKPYLAFSSYDGFFSYNTGGKEYVVNVKNNYATCRYSLQGNYEKAFKDVFFADEQHAFCKYGAYLLFWDKNNEDTLVCNLAKTTAFGYTNFVLLGGDSIVYADKKGNGLKVRHLLTDEEKIIARGNFADYDFIRKTSSELLFFCKIESGDNKGTVYTKLAFYNLKTHRFINTIDNYKFKRMSVDQGYYHCLATDNKDYIGNIYLIDNVRGGLTVLDSLKGSTAYDISDDGKYIAFVTRIITQQKIDNGVTKSLLWIYDTRNSSKRLVDTIYENLKTDNKFTIYGNYYFRFNTTSDKIAYNKDQKDSVFFTIKSLQDCSVVYSSQKVDNAIDDFTKTDFTGNYIHIVSKDKKEGIILLNNRLRNIAYFDRNYPMMNKEEWQSQVKSLGLEF